jgi:hypothetical protein
MKLNLACGDNYREGYINCDISHVVKADMYFDLRKEFPFDKDSADEILLLNVVGEILTNEDFLFVMNSCWDTLKDGCYLTVQCPDVRTGKSFKDPFECRHFTEETWWYFDKNTPQYKRFGAVYGFKPWNEVKIDISDGTLNVTLRK